MLLGFLAEMQLIACVELFFTNVPVLLLFSLFLPQWHPYFSSSSLFFPLALIYSLLLLVHSYALLLLSARQSCNCRRLVSSLPGCIFAQDFSSTFLVTWQLPANDCYLVTGNSFGCHKVQTCQEFSFFFLCVSLPNQSVCRWDFSLGRAL